MTKTIKSVCSSCGGTGLYSGMCEGPGVAVVCLTCDGTGNELIIYEPFKKRVGKRGIKKVFRSRGSFIVTGVGKRGEGISYEEFSKGKFPEA